MGLKLNEERDYGSMCGELAQTGFFSEYLPECFYLSDDVISTYDKNLPSKKLDMISPYPFTMSRFDKNDLRRTVFIPDICAHLNLFRFIKKESILKELIEFSENLDVSFSTILDENDKLLKHEAEYNLGGKRCQVLTC